MLPPLPGDGPAPDGGDSWDDAPCALLRLDERGRVVAANTRFLDRTGYRLSDAVGRMFWDELLAVGSRLFFQTQLAPVLELDGVLEEVMVDLRTADGQRLPALLNATSVRDGAGALGTRVAIMSVPDRRAYETELRQARDDAERARAADAEARQRLELLTQANTALASSVDVTVAVGRLAGVLVARLADWCVIYVRDVGEHASLAWAAAHADPAQTPSVERVAELLPPHTRPQSTFGRLLHGGEPILLGEVGEDLQHDSIDNAELRALLAALEVGSTVGVPSTARAAEVATIILVRRPGRSPFAAEDLADLTDLAARTGIVIDNLRRHAREHSNSIALQQALLTTPPDTAQLQIATRYLPATDGNQVGGDWYDAFLQPDGRPVLVIGDVVGHDIHAAAAMGQLRGVLRTLGYTAASTPADILTRSDAAARGLGVNVLASTLVARLESGPAGVTVLRWSNAGHPPPILINRHGARPLLTAPDRLLGLGPSLERPRHDHEVGLDVGDTLLLYTDGLIERADEDLDTGIARLLGLLADAAGAEPDEVCDLALSDHAAGTRDDIALLAARLVDGPDAPTVDRGQR